MYIISVGEPVTIKGRELKENNQIFIKELTTGFNFGKSISLNVKLVSILFYSKSNLSNDQTNKNKPTRPNLTSASSFLIPKFIIHKITSSINLN